MKRILECLAYREMLKNLTVRELQVRYKGSVLGFLWTFFNPLLLLVVYSIVFSFIMKSNIEPYPMFLFVALLPWNFMANSVLQGSLSLVQNAGLIKKVYFPRVVLPLSAAFANLINYVLSLAILIPALLLFKVKLSWALLSFPVVLFVETVLVIGLAVLVAVLNVYFRDLEHIIGVLMSVWFFLTPIIYPMDFVPKEARVYFSVNPMTPLIEAYRAIFFYGMWPDWRALGYCAAGFVIFLVVSFSVFDRLQRNVAEEL